MGIKPQPKISVVIFSYNFERYLSECIESILDQTLRPFEIVICDDHSIDNSWQVICKYSQKYPELIKAYRHERNIGQVANGNFGGSVFRGDWVALMDGDDRWLPRKLELEWKALQKYPAAKIAYSNVYEIDTGGKRTKIWYNGRGPVPPSGDLFAQVFSRCLFPNSYSVYRNELVHSTAFKAEGLCDINLESYWDWDRKIRYSARFPAVYSGEALVEYRIHSQGFHATFPEKHHRAMIQIYEKHLPLIEQRSKEEAISIKCNIEVVLAINHDRLFPNKKSCYSLRSVYRRNKKRLKSLSRYDRTAIEKKLSISGPYISFLIRASRNEMRRGNLKLALKYCREMNKKKIVFGILPQRVKNRLKSVQQGFHNLIR